MGLLITSIVVLTLSILVIGIIVSSEYHTMDKYRLESGIIPINWGKGSKAMRHILLSAGAKKALTMIVVWLVAILTDGTARAQVTFHKVWTEYDVVEDGNKGMRIHSDFTLSNMVGKKCLLVLSIGYNTGVPENNVLVRATDPKYIGFSASKGHSHNYLGAKKTLNCTYQNSRWRDLSLFIPYSAFPEGKHNYSYQLDITDTSERYLDQPYCRGSDSELVYFTVTRPAQPSTPRKRRVNYSDGSYADITKNLDGTETTVTYKPCHICHSRKVCSLCGGAGGGYSGFGTYQTYHLCTSCGGSGQCKYCYGTGMTVFTTTYNPGTNSTIGQDLWTGRTYTSDNAGRSSSRESKSVGSSTGGGNTSACVKCHGTGLDPTPSVSMGLTNWIGTYHRGGTKCNICGKWEEHWHDKCPHCNAPN